MITLIFDNSTKIPMYEQLYRFIRIEIESGRLAANEKLPSKRKLASHLKISIITIQTAYEQLVAEGYLRVAPKSGFFVQPFDNNHYDESYRFAKIPVDNICSNFKKNTDIQEIYDQERYENESHRQKYYKNEIGINEFHNEENNTKKSYEYEFKTNVVDTKLFPFATWAKLAREVLSENSDELLNITHPQGSYELRKEIANHLYNFRGIKITTEQIIIGAGSEHMIELLIQILGRNSVYALENPGYNKIYKIYKSNDVVTVPISLDEQGFNVENLRRTSANIAHVTPSHQFPSGIIMPVGRRKSLLKWANESSTRFIIEDDYDSEFRFSGSPIPALQGLDYEGKVIYLNAFTKTLAPSLRINYMVLPPKLLEAYQNRFMFHSCSVSNFEQYILGKFMNRGHFERHLFRMRNAYKKRRDRFMSAIYESKAGGIIDFIGYDAGLHLLMKINNGMSEAQLINKASEEGVRVYGLSEYYTASSQDCPESTVVIGYSGFDSSQIDAAVYKLEKAWVVL